MKRIIPHITIENCKEAIEYYAEVLNGEIGHTQLADGIEMFKGHEGKYIHAELHFPNGFAIYFNDVFGNEPIYGNNIEIGLEFESDEEIKQVYDAISKEGVVKMELQQTFWNATYGKVQDKYGVTWELNYRK
ncbi:VOC family protein [Heyndrickxia vini]|uniref:VOC family protein n=1 Tax=Heyndrickxia vini TaxID=1476025 RepID=A0ABX7DZI3_9BACI|nr:VOC family protein [Heyndrickxia vini]QQZ08881.1 VOC family protein [Heyndrickxia vini]